MTVRAKSPAHLRAPLPGIAIASQIPTTGSRQALGTLKPSWHVTGSRRVLKLSRLTTKVGDWLNS